MKEYAGKVLMISESPFPEDTRVKNEAFTLTQNNYKIFLVKTMKFKIHNKNIKCR